MIGRLGMVALAVVLSGLQIGCVFWTEGEKLKRSSRTLTSRMTIVETDISLLKEAVEELSDAKPGGTASGKKTEAALAAVKSDIESLNRRISSSSTGAEGTIEKLKVRQAGLAKEVAALSAAVDKLADRISESKKSVAKGSAGVKADVDTLSGAIRETHANIKSIDRKLSDMLKKLDAKSKTVEP